MTRFAGDKLAASGQGRQRAIGQRSRYAFNGFDRDNRRVQNRALDEQSSGNALRDETVAKRKAAAEEARQKALWAQG